MEAVAKGGPLLSCGGGSLPWVGGPRRRCRGLDLPCRRVVPGECGHARYPRPTGPAARLRALPIAAERLPHCLDLALLPHGPNDTAGPGCRLRGERLVKRRRGTGQARPRAADTRSTGVGAARAPASYAVPVSPKS
jgi:hypothetical protein